MQREALRRLFGDLTADQGQMGRMRNEDDKGDVELNVFRDFAAKVGPPLIGSRAEKRNPPAPDILCPHEQEGFVAFELAEICSPDIAQNIIKAIQTDAGGRAFRTSDRTQYVIRKKLSRSYDTPYPVELLCYTGGRTISWPELIIPRLKRELDSYEGTFRRVWLLAEDEVFAVWNTETGED